MERELLVVLLAVIVTIWMAVSWSAHAARGGQATPAVQAVGGLICGLLAAVVVAVPYVDVVPDQDEPAAEVLLVGFLVIMVAVAGVRWKRKRSRAKEADQPRITASQHHAAAQGAVVARRSGRQSQ